MQFSHLHCHVQYSLLDGQVDIKKLIKKAKADKISAVATISTWKTASLIQIQQKYRLNFTR